MARFVHYRSVLLTAALTALLAGQIPLPRPPAAQPRPAPPAGAKTGGKKVTELFYEIPLRSSEPVSAPVYPIRDEEVRALPRAQAPADGDCPRPFCNDALNSRLPRPLGRGSWAIRWEVPIDPAIAGGFVTRSGDRIAVQGSGYWRLFNRTGGPAGRGLIRSSPAVMDAASRLIYADNRTGAFEAARLADGQRVYLLSPAFGLTYVRPYLARRGKFLVVLGVETEAFPHRPSPPTTSVLEIHHLTEPVETDPLGNLLSESFSAQIRIGATKVAAAAHQNGVVLAVPNRIYEFDWNLKAQTAFEGVFDPVHLSLDEAGRSYLLVRVNRRLQLWIVNTEGRRIFRHEFPEDMGEPAGPPVIGYDHKIFVATAAKTYCLAPGQGQVWEAAAGGAGYVTADDMLLLSRGTRLVALDGRGRETLVREFENDRLLTPAILTAEGEILVASAKKLYCLARRSQ